MKKFLLAIAIILFVLGVFAILFGALACLAYNTTLDGSFSLYARQRMLMIVSFVAAAVFIAGGVLVCVKRSRM